MELREKKEYSIKLAISQFTPEYQSDDKVGALTPICEKQQKQFIHTPIFIRTSTLFEKATLRTEMFLMFIKRIFLFLVLIF